MKPSIYDNKLFNFFCSATEVTDRWKPKFLKTKNQTEVHQMLSPTIRSKLFLIVYIFLAKQIFNCLLDLVELTAFLYSCKAWAYIFASNLKSKMDILFFFPKTWCHWACSCPLHCFKCQQVSHQTLLRSSSLVLANPFLSRPLGVATFSSSARKFY